MVSVLPVVATPDPVLTRPANEVDPADAAVVQLAADLVETMRVSPGCVGLAATQVGVPSRVFVLDVTGHKKAVSCAGLVVLVNPRLVSASDFETGREGCMSVPDFTGDVARATSVVVRGLAPGSGEVLTYEADAFEARAFQHELDHLDGLLFLNRVSGAHAIYPRKRYL
ncbi:MAG: formylmethionine deformylase [Frankiales bacterium]|nr:formylmethionine deformylase [Frankiales bacterium]